jgi:hypothetical protein
MKRNGLFWTPRIIVILFALFTMLFSFDVFGEKAPWYRLALGFFMHNIPFIIIMLLLYLSWKRPLLGMHVFIFVMIGLANFVMTHGDFMVLVYLLIPPFIISVLFLFDYFQQKKFKEEMVTIPVTPEPVKMDPMEPVVPPEPIEPVEPEEQELKEKKAEEKESEEK